MDLHLTITEAHQGLRTKNFSCVELTQNILARVRERQSDINAFVTVLDEEALEQAARIDKKITSQGELGALEGIPCAVKDNMVVEGVSTTAGSAILKNYRASYDATVVSKLKQEGVVIVGKTNMDEFAMGSSGETSAFGPTKNPLDPARVPGGSSSGSAAAVSDAQCIFALGSDTGGSIRQPASFCGIVGFKPTYGAVSRAGLIAMASSLDQIGPLTRSVEDAEIVFDAIRGRDPLDSTSADVPESTPGLGIKNLKIGVPKEYFIEGMDQGVEKAVRAALQKFEAAGANISEVSLPLSPYALAVYYILMPAEVSANLARYDGIRYSATEISNLKSQISNLYEYYVSVRGQGFGDEVRRRVMLGTYVLSAGYRDAYYRQAQKVRSLIAEEFRSIFQTVDVLVTPTAPTTAFRLGEKFNDPLTMYLSDIFTVSVNVAGIPGLSLPCGESGGLPVGLQIIGPAWSDRTILAIGRNFETML